MLVIAFLSNWVTEWIGIHALFGAFFAGVIWPRGEAISRTGIEEASAKLEPIAMIALIPLFFSYTGIRTNIGLIGGAGAWPYAAVIVAAAVAGKVGGAFLGGTIMRFGMRDSLALGALLNTRGLVELIALNVGLDLGILSPSLFSMMVLMALTTTLMTVPRLRYILPRGKNDGTG
jgi:Kef-type K+ transport system membrane component KefB